MLDTPDEWPQLAYGRFSSGDLTKPSRGLQVTYRKLGRSPMLMADDLVRNN